MKTKILIACPTLGLEPNPQKWLASLLVIVQDLRRNNIDMGFCFPFRSGSIHKAENTIIHTALTNEYTHILRLDDDIWGIMSGDVMKLLNADKEFISAVMYIRGFPYQKCAFRKTDKTMSLQAIEDAKEYFLEEVTGEGIQPCDLTASPFTLYSVSIFSKVLFPWYDNTDKHSPDTVFCQKCLDKGIQPFVHLDIQLNHREVTPWNRAYLFNSEARRLLMAKKIDPTTRMYKTLVELFGSDGMKDLGELKGVNYERP